MWCLLAPLSMESLAHWLARLLASNREPLARSLAPTSMGLIARSLAGFPLDKLLARLRASPSVFPLDRDVDYLTRSTALLHLRCTLVCVDQLTAAAVSLSQTSACMHQLVSIRWHQRHHHCCALCAS